MRRLLIAAFWAALLFAFVMALVPKPMRLPGNPADKLQHITAFAVLTALALAAYPGARPLAILLSLALFGAAIELLQTIPTLKRDGAWIDWAADCGAVAVVLLIGVPVRRALLRGSPSPP